MPFMPVDPDLNLVALEGALGAQWVDEQLFEATLRHREGAPEWVFYEGPPTANGKPGIHHVWARVFKDLYPRFHTMRGRHVARKGGWDCHGLPVELEVEKALGFSGKAQIEEYGIEQFNARCRESVFRYVEDWAKLTARIGMWIDTDDAYWTLTNEYVESVWWHFRRLWDDGLIYEGFKVVPYCGRCGTALSSHEVALGYRDVTEESVYVRFPLEHSDQDLVVWTTTPWTLVSNVGVAVGPDVDYVRVADPHGGRELVLAASRVDAVLGADAEILGHVDASDLVGRTYRRPITTLTLEEEPRVVAAAFVTVDDGSGLVHLAPAFGEVDREVGELEGLGMLNPVNAEAAFDESVPEYAGRFVKDADPAIIAALEADGLLLSVEEFTHSYPHCWRCDTPLVYWAKPTWFARTSDHKEALLAQNETIGWHPSHIKHGRFGDWLENNVDWALSRDRYWGTPMPVWRCEDCRHDACLGSVAELAQRSGADLGDLDLHRPFVDDVTISCSECGGRAVRIAPVLDAWFDSGSMPAAQFHHPFDEQSTFESRFPADFICEAIDQTRGWFYSLLAINTLVFGETPYRNVVCLGLLVDADGQKMSKSRGNVIDPWDILTTRGADALRWNFFSAGAPWSPKRVSPENIDETTRRFLLTLWNTYSFFVTYANLDGWRPGARVEVSHVLDRWILARLDETVTNTTNALEGFDAFHGAQAIGSFVDDLSNWYVRRSRPRFWNSEDDSAHGVLHLCLVTVTRLLAPFCPFVSDVMHRNLVARDPAAVEGSSHEDSVHLADWPTPSGLGDDALIEPVDRTRRLVSLGLAARNDARMKVRQPLRRALVLGADGLDADLLHEMAEALNVKRIEPVTDLEGLVHYDVVPNFRSLGPRAGSNMPAVRDALERVDVETARARLDTEGSLSLRLEDGTAFEVTAEDVEIRAGAHDELVLAQEQGLAVALDVTIDHDLRLEGIARELARLVNDRRKEAGFELSDRIEVTLTLDGDDAEAARRHGEWIAGEVLATSWEVLDGTAGAREIDLRRT